MTQPAQKKWWQTWAGRRRCAAAALVLLPLVCVFAPESEHEACRARAEQLQRVGFQLLEMATGGAALPTGSADGGAP